jgi:hypothetical protein
MLAHSMRAALVAALATLALVSVGVATAHPGGKPITRAQASSELITNGVYWEDGYSNTIVSARCAGEGKATRRGSRRLYTHFSCAVRTKQTLPYRLRLHSIGKKDLLYTADFLGWTSYGSRSRPVPFGSAAALGDGWTVKVLSLNTDAAPDVLDYQKGLTDEDERASIAPGNRLVLARISATRTAAYPGRVNGAALRVVAASGIVSRYYGCGVFPNDIGLDQVFPGSAIEGNVCWQVPATDVGSLLLFNEAAPPYAFFSLVS